MEFNITVNELKAFEIIAKSSDATRYYLRGISVEYLQHNNKLALVATDGHRMLFKVFDPATDEDTPIAFNNFEPFILPVETIKQAIAGLKGHDTLQVSVKVNEQKVWQHTIGNLTFRPIDGTYPNWKRVIPSKINNEPAQFDPRYLGEFGKIAKLLGSKSGSIHAHHNGNEATNIELFAPDYYGVLMPKRTSPTSAETYLSEISDNLNLQWADDSPVKIAVNNS